MEAPEQQSQLELSQQPQPQSAATSKPMSRTLLTQSLESIKPKQYKHWKKRDVGTQTDFEPVDNFKYSW
jgi:hypothetical protein